MHHLNFGKFRKIFNPQDDFVLVSQYHTFLIGNSKRFDGLKDHILS